MTARRICLALSVLSAVRADPVSIMEASKGPLAFLWQQIGNGAAAFSVNASADTTVSLEISELVCLPNGAAASPPRLRVALADSGPFDLKANVPRRLFLTRLSEPPQPCSYNGTILIRDSSGKAISAPALLSVTVPAVVPLLPKLSVTLWRWLPACSSCLISSAFYLPLTEKRGLAGLGGHLVGGIRRDNVGWTKVRWQSSGAGPGIADEALRIDAAPNAGVYTGDLKLADDPPSPPFNLSVNVKDIVVWPIAVMTLGTWLAFVVKRYVGVRRVILALRLEEAQLSAAFTEAQRQFDALARRRPFAKYSIAADFQARRIDILQNLNLADRTSRTSLDQNDKNYQAAVTLLQSMEDALVAWPKLASALADLSSSIERTRSAVDGSQMEPPTVDPAMPDFLDAAALVLEGRPIAIGDIANVEKAAADATVMANAWQDLRQKVADLTAQFRALPATATDDPLFASLATALATLWIHLNEARDIASLNMLAAQGGEVANVETSIAQIRNSAGPASKSLLPARAAFFAMTLPDAVDPIAPLQFPGPAANSRSAELLKLRIAASDRAAMIFSGLVGLLTGLQTFYFGKPFGTVSDYSAVFVWAAGTKVALDMLAGVLDRLTNLNRSVSVQAGDPHRVR